MSRSTIQVYLDITIGTQPCGRLVFRLFADLTPKAVENFRGLVTGEYGLSRATGKPLSYRGTRFFRLVPGLLLQGGDTTHNDGSGGESIWGAPFADESFARRHAQAGCLSLANNGRNTNASQFFITLKKAPQFDGKHVVIGQLIEGMTVLRAMQLVPVHPNTQTPRVDIVVAGCGQLASPSALRLSSISAVRAQLDLLTAKHLKEVTKQNEQSTKLRGSDDESVSSSSSSEDEGLRADRKRRQERRLARYRESNMFAAKQAMDKLLAGVPLQQQLQPEAAAAAAAAAAEAAPPGALYEGESSSSEDEADTQQQTAAEAAAMDPLGNLLLQLQDEEGLSQTDDETAATNSSSSNSSSSSISSSSSKGAARSALAARKQKLLALRLQINQGRALNIKEVVEEKKQYETPAAAAAKTAAEIREAYRRLHRAPMYQLYRQEAEAADSAAAAAAAAAGGGETGTAAASSPPSSSAASSSSSAPTPGAPAAAAAAAAAGGESSGGESEGESLLSRDSLLFRRRNILDVPLAFSEEQQKTKKKKEKGTFGWNVFNEDALYRAHKKRLAEVPLRAEEYRQQQQQLGEAFYDPLAALSHPDHKPSSQGLERLASSLAAAQKRRGKFSRRRAFDEEADVSYVNERNRIFNNKLERSFDTREIKQNFERGTAL